MLDAGSGQLFNGIVSIIGIFLAAGALVVSARQGIRQVRMNRENLMLANLDAFSERYQAVSALRRTLVSRFSNGDLSLNREDCMVYYNRYWALRHLAWDYYKRGLIPSDTFSGWMENVVRHIADRQNLKCYEQGTAVELHSREIFLEYAMERLFKRHPDCRSFFQGLYALCVEMETKDIALDSDDAFRRIVRHVTARKTIKSSLKALH